MTKGVSLPGTNQLNTFLLTVKSQQIFLKYLAQVTALGRCCFGVGVGSGGLGGLRLGHRENN